MMHLVTLATAKNAFHQLVEPQHLVDLKLGSWELAIYHVLIS